MKKTIEEEVESWSFFTIFGLLWGLVKINYLAKKRKEEVQVNLLFPMEWL